MRMDHWAHTKSFLELLHVPPFEGRLPPGLGIHTLGRHPCTSEADRLGSVTFPMFVSNDSILT